jgi:hypothetical protein
MPDIFNNINLPTVFWDGIASATYGMRYSSFASDEWGMSASFSTPSTPATGMALVSVGVRLNGALTRYPNREQLGEPNQSGGNVNVYLRAEGGPITYEPPYDNYNTPVSPGKIIIQLGVIYDKDLERLFKDFYLPVALIVQPSTRYWVSLMDGTEGALTTGYPPKFGSTCAQWGVSAHMDTPREAAEYFAPSPPVRPNNLQYGSYQMKVSISE